MHEKSTLRADVAVHQMCAKTGKLERSKRSTDVLATVDDAGVKGLSVRTRPKQTTIAEGGALRGSSIIDRFVHEGKATIALPAARMYVFVSNADPRGLREWLEQLAPWLGIEKGSRPQLANGCARAALATAPAARANARRRDEEDCAAECDAAATKRARPSDEPALSAEQQAVVSCVLGGRSLDGSHGDDRLGRRAHRRHDAARLRRHRQRRARAARARVECRAQAR
jgi:hypothetical protein